MGNVLDSLTPENVADIVIGYDLVALTASACIYNNIKNISYNYYKDFFCKEHMKNINKIEWVYWLSGCCTGAIGMQLFNTLMTKYIE